MLTIWVDCFLVPEFNASILSVSRVDSLLLCTQNFRSPIQHTVLVAKAAITKYQTGWPDNRNLFSQSRGQKSKIKMLAKLVPSDASVLGL